MIIISAVSEQDIHIVNPFEIPNLRIGIKNLLVKNFEKGLIIVKSPDDFNQMDKSLNPKKHKNIYRIGFIFDSLTVLYPQYGKMRKAEIIAEQFEFDITYRQFQSLYDFYDANREKYLSNRQLLGLYQ